MAEPLVLLPDLMCDARLFGPQIADLSREIAVTVAPVSSGERVEEVASALLDVLPRRFALVGLGLGGMVAMELQRRAPDRVARLMLISTTPLAETPQQAAELDPLIIKARTGRLREAVRALRPVDSLAPGPFRMEIQAMLDEMAEGLGVDVFTRQIRVLQRRRDQQSALRKLRVPVTVLCGAHDITLPVKRHAFLAELIPGARLEVIEDAGHLPPLEAPDAVSDAIRDWLQAPMLPR
ncbi:Pimeloyl-ACP methyl ester carboxylesterase [Salipiger thiooxidans]|uniref:Pimeloyl-ACP methyl ester carboxylesterase n=1 Tax=Salipiger thiooxidans TaxID=282683 RepID=A0A1G7BPI2_9RHOB|nr:alpha/beta fold hydrolase [Salipiger thiooxidans]SDE28863.1 Pimeloyl-ACP methyl ester carboxylesterase [Salipiger thiooxidans]